MIAVMKPVKSVKKTVSNSVSNRVFSPLITLPKEASANGGNRGLPNKSGEALLSEASPAGSIGFRYLIAAAGSSRGRSLNNRRCIASLIRNGCGGLVRTDEYDFSGRRIPAVLR